MPSLVTLVAVEQAAGDPASVLVTAFPDALDPGCVAASVAGFGQRPVFGRKRSG